LTIDKVLKPKDSILNYII